MKITDGKRGTNGSAGAGVIGDQVEPLSYV